MLSDERPLERGAELRLVMEPCRRQKPIAGRPAAKLLFVSGSQ